MPPTASINPSDVASYEESVGSDEEWDCSTVADKDDPLRASASIPASILNLTNNIVGAGLFSLPWCLRQSTMVTGCILMLIICVLNTASFVLLAMCCELAQTCSYLKMMQRAFGDRWGALAQVTVLMYACGSCISFVVLTGDFLVDKETGIFERWASHTFLYGESYSRAVVMSIIAAVVFFPLSMLRNLETLKYTSFVSFFATLYAMVLCVWALGLNSDISYPDDEDRRELRSSYTVVGFPAGVFAALPLINVAYTCHYNAPRYYAELRGRCVRRWTYVVGGVMSFVFFVYTTTAVTGYLVFGKETKGDVLKNFSPDWDPPVVARLALALLVVFTFPMTAHFIRDSFIDLWYKGEYSTDSCPLLPYTLITSAIVVVATTIGVACTQVEVVLAYKGAIFGSLMVYILPPLMFAMLRHQHTEEAKKRGSTSRRFSISKMPSKGSLRRSSSAKGTPAIDTKSDTEGGSVFLLEHAAPGDCTTALKALFVPSQALMSALFVWGILSGIMGVGVTILKNADVIKTD